MILALQMLMLCCIDLVPIIAKKENKILSVKNWFYGLQKGLQNTQQKTVYKMSRIFGGRHVCILPSFVDKIF